MSINRKKYHLLSAGLFLIIFGCTTMPSNPVVISDRIPEPPRPTAPRPNQADVPKKPAVPEKAAPRTVASLKLTERARWLIESKKPDDAIRTLEKAMNIDPGNGQNYYFLAEAWLQKNNWMQAIEFNRIAEIYLNEDAVWMPKVRQQKERIEKALSKSKG